MRGVCDACATWKVRGKTQWYNPTPKQGSMLQSWVFSLRRCSLAGLVWSVYDTSPKGVGGLFLSSTALNLQKPCAVLQTQVVFFKKNKSLTFHAFWAGQGLTNPWPALWVRKIFKWLPESLERELASSFREVEWLLNSTAGSEWQNWYQCWQLCFIILINKVILSFRMRSLWCYQILLSTYYMVESGFLHVFFLSVTHWKKSRLQCVHTQIWNKSLLKQYLPHVCVVPSHGNSLLH